MRRLYHCMQISYFIGLHLLIFILILKTDTYSSIQRVLGFNSPDVFNERYYQVALGHQLRQHANTIDNSLLLFGDSMIQGLNPYLLAEKATNFGIGGETSLDLLTRLPLYKLSSFSGRVVIGVGVNDIEQRAGAEISDNVATILTQLDTTSTVYLLGLLPISEEREKQWKIEPQKIETLNKRLQQLCEKRGNVNYIAPPGRLVDGRYLAQQYDSGDGLHLNAAGYAAWADYLNEVLFKKNS